MRRFLSAPSSVAERFLPPNGLPVSFYCFFLLLIFAAVVHDSLVQDRTPVALALAYIPALWCLLRMASTKYGSCLRGKPAYSAHTQSRTWVN